MAILILERGATEGMLVVLKEMKREQEMRRAVQLGA